jgi:20S proteasome subunit beta 7
MSALLPQMPSGMFQAAHGNQHPMMAAQPISSFQAPVHMFEARSAPAAQPISHTQSPIVTGASVLAVKYADGVMVMADTMGSYGSMGMFKALTRIRQVNEFTLLGGGGEYSDLQYILKMIEQLRINDFATADGAVLTPAEIHSYLGRVMYNRRSKVDPLWNQLITAGFYQGKPFLGMTDMYGSTYTADLLATGYGLHLAIPLLRKRHRPDMSYEEARTLLEDCMKVLFYRDCRTLNSFQLATIGEKGATISAPYSVETQWELKRQISPSSAD